MVIPKLLVIFDFKLLKLGCTLIMHRARMFAGICICICNVFILLNIFFFNYLVFDHLIFTHITILWYWYLNLLSNCQKASSHISQCNVIVYTYQKFVVLAP